MSESTVRRHFYKLGYQICKIDRYATGFRSYAIVDIYTNCPVEWFDTWEEVTKALSEYEA